MRKLTGVRGQSEFVSGGPQEAENALWTGERAEPGGEYEPLKEFLTEITRVRNESEIKKAARGLSGLGVFRGYPQHDLRS